MVHDVLTAIPFGIILAFTIGPVFFVLLETGATKGFKPALIFDLGVIFADILFYSIGIYEYSIFTALTTGLLLGSVGFIYIRNVLFDYLNKI